MIYNVKYNQMWFKAVNRIPLEPEEALYLLGKIDSIEKMIGDSARVYPRYINIDKLEELANNAVKSEKRKGTIKEYGNYLDMIRKITPRNLLSILEEIKERREVSEQLDHLLATLLLGEDEIEIVEQVTTKEA